MIDDKEARAMILRSTGVDTLRSTNPKGPIVMIATPAYTGIDPLHLRSLLESSRELAKHGYRVMSQMTIGQSLEPNARAEIFGKFLASDAEWLFLVDPKVSWERDLILRLIAFGEPVIACSVPEILRDDGVLMPGQSLVDEGGPSRTSTWESVEDRYVRIMSAPDDLFLLRKDAARAVAEKNANLAIRVGDTKTFAVFHPLIESWWSEHGAPPVTKRYGRRVAFTRRCSRAGLPVWLSTSAITSRTGTFTALGRKLCP